MWNALVFWTSGWQEARFFEIPELPTIDAILVAARERLSNDVPLIQHLEAEALERTAESGRIGREPIAVFAERAQRESEEFEWSTGTKVTALEDGAIGMSLVDSTSAAPSVIAWHEPTAVILTLDSDSSEIRVEYVPDQASDDRIRRLRYKYGAADYRLETIFDWRAYFGLRSATIDGSTEMHPDGARFVTRARMPRLRGRFGYAIGRVLRRLTFGQPTLHKDPLAVRRERAASTEYPQIARLCPLLSDRNHVEDSQAMVFVHGTASCGLQGLKDLFAVAPPHRYSVRRFEHDTFVSYLDNADELTKLIQATIHVDRLLVVAHSRGGLVARAAVENLIRAGYQAAISLQTFGTPHAGTPLVQIGGRLLAQLYKIGEWGLNIVAPTLSPLTWAHGFLFDAPELPPGVAIMKEDSEGLRTLNRYGDRVSVMCWGSRFDINDQESGFGIEVGHMLAGAMHDVDSDLVVPTSSALAFGTPAPVLTCSHVQYFSQPAVRTSINNYFTPPAPIAAGH
jgi:pimeloyl-ACP methyl ester carboxylesterase